MKRGQPQERLERRHRRAASVEPKRELIEVHLQVLVADAVMSAEEPRLEVAEDAMNPGQEFRGSLGVPLGAGAMPVAEPGQGSVRRPPVSGDDRSGLDKTVPAVADV